MDIRVKPVRQLPPVWQPIPVSIDIRDQRVGSGAELGKIGDAVAIGIA